jgi:hypothetical protein
MPRELRKSILNRYDVDTVPAVLLPFFYLFSYGCAAVCLVYAVIVHYTSKIVFEGEKHLESHPNYILCRFHSASFTCLDATPFMVYEGLPFVSSVYWSREDNPRIYGASWTRSCPSPRGFLKKWIFNCSAAGWTRGACFRSQKGGVAYRIAEWDSDTSNSLPNRKSNPIENLGQEKMASPILYNKGPVLRANPGNQ